MNRSLLEKRAIPIAVNVTAVPPLIFARVFHAQVVSRQKSILSGDRIYLRLSWAGLAKMVVPDIFSDAERILVMEINASIADIHGFPDFMARTVLTAELAN